MNSIGEDQSELCPWWSTYMMSRCLLAKLVADAKSTEQEKQEKKY